jgi:hypothetical protein
MNYEEWEQFYRKIIKDFGFSEFEDTLAAKILKKKIRSPLPLDVVERLIRGKITNIFGAGPSLEKIKSFPSSPIIAADGATSYLLEKKVIPDIIVTDLDGEISDLMKANELGSILFIHAHGDNITSIRKHAEKFKNCIPTTQATPLEGVYNFGGFTDGDRAVFIADHFRAKKIVLYAMDFGKEIGRYSFTKYPEMKIKKLNWAKKLISYLAQQRSTGYIEFYSKNI